ncbi:MAG TPA: tetratricopeptide repeat protein, partial [Armatimonadota bacterium]|nr:tetratricopeptide repeat protein [Armatimonadota bacterium]
MRLVISRIAANGRAGLLTLALGAVTLLGGVAGVVNGRRSTGAEVTPQDRSALAATLTARLPQATTSPIPALVQHVRLNPRDREARYRLAHRYFQSSDYPRALEELRILEKQDPRDPGVPLRRAVILKSEGRADAAEKAVRQALNLQPGNAQAELLLGDIYLDQRQYRKAVKVFDRHLQAQPNSIAALMAKARVLERLYLAQERVKVDEILAPVKKAAELAPNNPRVLGMFAKMKFAYLISPEDTAEAEGAALRAVQLAPQNSQPYITLAQIYLAREPTADNLRKAAEYAASAGTLNLNDPRPPYVIGRVALLQNDPQRATKALELSLQLGPMPETVTQLAAAYARVGDRARAGYYSG